MPKIKISKPSATVAKKDNTRVARTRVNELVGDKPDYQYIKQAYGGKATKSDSINYNKGFREQILKDKKAGKAIYPDNISWSAKQMGREEAYYRRWRGDFYKSTQPDELKPGAKVRDSSIPLAPTQFPE
jgi:hypothetical protein